MKINNAGLVLTAFINLHVTAAFLPLHPSHTPIYNVGGTVEIGTARRIARDSPLRLAASEKAKKENDAGEKEKQTPATPEPLQPFLPALDPMYSVRGPVGEDDFIVSRHGGPQKEELSNENLLKILLIKCTDLEVNTLVWKCLGYRFDSDNEKWLNTECFPKWKEKYPEPPDLIGMKRMYSKEHDQPSLKANQAIVRSVPVDNKQSLKTHLKPHGFKGYQVSKHAMRGNFSQDIHACLTYFLRCPVLVLGAYPKQNSKSAMRQLASLLQRGTFWIHC
mmetsp:Transcript_4570/g.12799  ORF Transcript_4570/g.12799 Transcript_4570/m.12799 type:complete len:277 (+) Transcript_4570:342-1172(+)